MPLALIVNGAVFLLLALALTAWLVRVVLVWRERRDPWLYMRPRYPVVLVHGLLGFDQIELGGARTEYFRGIGEHLVGNAEVVMRAEGVWVYCAGGLVGLGGVIEITPTAVDIADRSVGY